VFVFKKEKSILPSIIANSGLTVFKRSSNGKFLLVNVINGLSFYQCPSFRQFLKSLFNLSINKYAVSKKGLVWVNVWVSVLKIILYLC